MGNVTPIYAYVITIFIGLIAIIVESIFGYQSFPTNYIIYMIIYIVFGTVVGLIWPASSWKIGLLLPFFPLLMLVLMLIIRSTYNLQENEEIESGLLYDLLNTISKSIFGGVGSYLGSRIRVYKKNTQNNDSCSKKLNQIELNLGEEQENKVPNRRRLKILTFCGVSSALIPITILGLWLFVSGNSASHEESQAQFYGYLPKFLKGRYDSTYFSIGFSVLAIIFSSISLQLSGIVWKLLNGLILIICVLLFILGLFWLM